MPRITQEITLIGEPESLAFGARLAAILAPGHLVLLEGDLGSGKTTLARAVIRTLMDDPKMDVPSPSFALVQPYEKGALSIVHADLYRLSDALELEELGITENPEAIVLVEWPERAPELATRADVRIQFELMEKGKSRRLALSSPSGQIDLNQLN